MEHLTTWESDKLLIPIIGYTTKISRSSSMVKLSLFCSKTLARFINGIKGEIRGSGGSIEIGPSPVIRPVRNLDTSSALFSLASGCLGNRISRCKCCRYLQ
jgi:hypothetical protein